MNMDSFRDLSRRPEYAAGAGFVIGLLIGWMVLGWFLFPVNWTDAGAADLRPSVKMDYLRMAVDSFSRNQNVQLAQQRWQELGSDAPELLAALQIDQSTNAADIANFSIAVQPSGVAGIPSEATRPAEAGQEGATAQAGLPPLATTAPAAANGSSPVTLLLVFCLLTLVIAGALVYILVLRKRGGPSILTPMRKAQEASRTTEKTDYVSEGQEAPISQFVTTYMLGDDLYDDSFSIDSPGGEFLGECGVGISDTIGVGDPKKVTAFEVWLFDKNDIQTVTKVLMSMHAFDDAAISQRLASKGEPILVQPGKRVLLETATLILEARIVDVNYGQGALPPNSFFERLTLELAIWQKATA